MEPKITLSDSEVSCLGSPPTDGMMQMSAWPNAPSEKLPKAWWCAKAAPTGKRLLSRRFAARLISWPKTMTLSRLHKLWLTTPWLVQPRRAQRISLKPLLTAKNSVTFWPRQSVGQAKKHGLAVRCGLGQSIGDIQEIPTGQKTQRFPQNAG